MYYRKKCRRWGVRNCEVCFTGVYKRIYNRKFRRTAKIEIREGFLDYLEGLARG